MDLKQIKELMTAMGRSGTKRLSIKKDGFELRLEREGGKAEEVAHDYQDEAPFRNHGAHRANAMLSKHGTDIPTALNPPVETVKVEKEDTTSIFVVSPMVGTFYASPSPDDPSFVKVGDKIEKNTVVCIIEAMKVMNEIKAGVSGTVVEVLVDSAHPVEFGSKLFRIT